MVSIGDNDLVPVGTYNEESGITTTIYASDDIIRQLDNLNLNSMDPLQLVTLLGKLCLTTNHDSNKIAVRESEFKKKTSVHLRFQIKECANTKGWMFFSGIGVAINAGGLIAFGAIAMQQGAQAGQNAIQATQAASTICQPFTAYCQQRDEAAKTAMQSDQQVVNSDRDNQKQNLSAREQTIESMKQQLQQLMEKNLQAVNSIFGH